MNIVNPALYLLLGICLLLIGMLWKRERWLQKRFTRYADRHLQPFYYQDRSPFWTGFRIVMLILALALIIVALSRPQWDYETRNLESNGMDIVFALDVSKSMDATDMMPNRLLRATMQISSFIPQLNTDRIGIIAFAGVATLQCPLTDDYEAVRLVLNSLNSDSVVQPGTDLGAALSLAETAFMNKSNTNTLILISDGEDLKGQGIKQAQKLKNKGIRVYCMGVGSPEGAVIKHPISGQEVTSKLDEAILQEIAALTGGEYYRVTPGGDEIQLILKRIYASETNRYRTKNISARKEQYYLFAGLALLILLLEPFIDARRRKSGLWAAQTTNGKQ